MIEEFAKGFTFEGGGMGAPFMWAILVVSIFLFGVAIERFLFLVIKFNINAKTFFDQIQKYVMSDKINEAINTCNSASAAALPKVIKAGLTRANRQEYEISQAIEEAQLAVVPVVQKRTEALAGLSNIATLIGLLGTIIGMIEAFKALAAADPETQAKLLAKGISAAMMTTAFGLIVAIPGLTFHMILSGFTKKILDEIDQYSVKLENLLVARVKSSKDNQ